MPQLVINNFTRGQLDHDLNGRFDLPLYQKGFEVSRNFISNYKGNIKYRTGWQYEGKAAGENECVLMEFRFNSDQSYLLEFTEDKLRFYTYDANGNFGIVVDESPINEIPTLSSNSQDGYVVSDSRSNADCYTLFNGVSQYKTIGSWSTYWIQAQYPVEKIVKQYKIQADSYGSAEYPSSWSFMASDNGQDWITLDSQNGQSFSLGQEKTYEVDNDTSYLYYRLSFHSGRVSSGNGELKRIQFMTYNTSPSPIELETDITLQQAKKLKKAQNSDVMYLTMDEINPKKLTRTSASSFTIENATPSGIDFDETGYPACVTFYSGRLWFAGFTKKPLSVYGSEVAEYDNFVVPESNIDDEDPLLLTLSEITDPIEWLLGGKANLYAGNAEGVSIINGGSYDVPITAVDVDASLANKEGSSAAFPTQKDAQVFYISNDKRKVYMFDYDLLTEKFLSTDLNWLAQEVSLGKLAELYYKRDNNSIIYCRMESGQVAGLLFNSRENIMGWFPLETNGNVTSMCTVTRPDGYDDLFICVNRENGWYIERLAQEVEFSKFYQTLYFRDDDDKLYYNRLIAEDLKKCIYLDNASRIYNLINADITYNNGVITSEAPIFLQNHVGHFIVYKTKTGKEYGYFEIKSYISPTEVNVEVASEGYYPETWGEFYITFNEISNLKDFEGQTVQVVADGGYLGDFEVNDGKITFDRDMTSCVVGFSYAGLLKTFNLGMNYNGVNYQTTRKRIAEFVLRFVSSAGVKVGTDLKDMMEVQYFSPQGFLDLPPLPMDGDEKRTVPDNSSEDKNIFIIQDLPLPVNLTMLQYNIEFGR